MPLLVERGLHRELCLSIAREPRPKKFVKRHQTILFFGRLTPRKAKLEILRQASEAVSCHLHFE